MAKARQHIVACQERIAAENGKSHWLPINSHQPLSWVNYPGQARAVLEIVFYFFANLSQRIGRRKDFRATAGVPQSAQDAVRTD